MIKYTCAGTDDIPVEIRESGEFLFPEAHYDADIMTRLALAVKDFKKDAFASVPFCLTAEAEALGGIIERGNNRVGPRIKAYAYKKLEELLTIDYETALNSSQRLNSLLDSVKQINRECPVVMNLNGLFTLLCSLIDISAVFRGMKNDEKTVREVLGKLSGFAIRFAELALKSGAKVISYADPLSDAELVGTKLFGEFLAPATLGTITEISEKLGKGNALHICGRLTNGLKNARMVDIVEINIEGSECYGDALIKYADRENAPIVGNSCIKRTPEKSGFGNSINIWRLKCTQKIK